MNNLNVLTVVILDNWHTIQIFYMNILGQNLKRSVALLFEFIQTFIYQYLINLNCWIILKGLLEHFKFKIKAFS